MSRTVLLVVSVLDGTGPGMVFTTLAGELAGAGWDPVLVATHGPTSSPLIDRARAAGIAVEHLGMRTIWDAPAIGRFLRLCRRYRPAVVHTRTVRADLVGRVAAPTRVPVLNNLVNLYPDDSVAMHGARTGRVLTSLMRASRGAARLLVANAEAVATNARIAFGAPADRVRVVYDGLALDNLVAPPADLRSLGIGPEDRVCLTVGRLHPQKGLPDLVAAAASLPPGVHVVLAGDGPDRVALERAVTAAGLGRRVHLLGQRDDVPALLARADLFVLPSRFEGLPSAIIEAMAAGTAVVATSVGGVPELVTQNVTGWLVPPASPGALADAITEALERDLDAVGRAGRRRAEALFSAPSMGAAFAALYEEVEA